MYNTSADEKGTNDSDFEEDDEMKGNSSSSVSEYAKQYTNNSSIPHVVTTEPSSNSSNQESSNSNNSKPVPIMNVSNDTSTSKSLPRVTTTVPSLPTTEGYDPGVMKNFSDRCKYIPMRLTDEERKLLAVLENALEVRSFINRMHLIKIVFLMNQILYVICGQ